MTADEYQRALGHLSAAMEAMAACGDTLAMALIAEAMSAIEREMRLRSAA